MKTRLLLLPALLFASLTAACAEDTEPQPGSYTEISWCTPEDFERPDLEVVAVNVAPAPSAGLGIEAALDGAVEPNPTACDCTDDSCMVDWIADNMGCGVCVTLVCGEGPNVGGCLPCAEPTPSEPARDNAGADSSPCVLAPAETNPPGWDVQVEPSTGAEPAPSGAPDLTLEGALQG